MKRKIKKIVKRFVEYIKKDIKKGKKEIEGVSKTKYLMTFFLGMIFTWILQMIIYNNHASNFQGDKLKNYFLSEIYSELECDEECILNLQYMTRVEEEVLSGDKIIIIGERIYKNGDRCRIITIFERDKKGVLEFVLNVEPNYKITYMMESEPLQELEFEYRNIEYYDLDMDGDKEIVLDFESNYATAVADFSVILSNEDDCWHTILPDFSSLQKDIDESKDKYTVITYEMSVFDKIGNKKYVVNGLSRGGELGFFLNSNYNIMDFCYKIPLLKSNQGLIGIDTYAYIMLRLEGMELVIDKSWNFGEILIEKELTMEEVTDYYGIKQDGVIFYGLP